MIKISSWLLWGKWVTLIASRKIKNNDLYLRINCYKPLIIGQGSGGLKLIEKLGHVEY